MFESPKLAESRFLQWQIFLTRCCQQLIKGSAPFSRDRRRSLALKSPVQATLKADKRSAEMGILLNGVFWSHRQPSSRGPGDRFKTLSLSSRLTRRCMQAPWTPDNDLIRNKSCAPRNRSWPIRKILKKIFQVKNFRLSRNPAFLADLQSPPQYNAGKPSSSAGDLIDKVVRG